MTPELIVMLFMLTLLIAGSVAYCVKVGREARTARQTAEALCDALNHAERRMDEMGVQLATLRENAPQSATEADKKAAETARQFDAMQGFALPPEYGLRFGGDK